MMAIPWVQKIIAMSMSYLVGMVIPNGMTPKKNHSIPPPSHHAYQAWVSV